MLSLSKLQEKKLFPGDLHFTIRWAQEFSREEIWKCTAPRKPFNAKHQNGKHAGFAFTLSCWNIINGWAAIVPVRRPQSNWTHFILLSPVAMEYAIHSKPFRAVKSRVTYATAWGKLCGVNHCCLPIVIYSAEFRIEGNRKTGFLILNSSYIAGRVFW